MDTERLTIAEAAKAYPALSEAAIRTAISQKRLPVSREGRLLTVTRGDLVKYLNNRYVRR